MTANEFERVVTKSIREGNAPHGASSSYKVDDDLGAIDAPSRWAWLTSK